MFLNFTTMQLSVLFVAQEEKGFVSVGMTGCLCLCCLWHTFGSSESCEQ